MVNYNKLKLMAGAAAVSAVMLAGAAQAFPVANAIYYGNAGNDMRIINISTAAQPKEFVVRMGDEAINFLGDPALDLKDKKEKFRTLLNSRFDMKTIGRFVMGPNWKKLDQTQQTEYQALFEELIVSIYSERFSDYQGQKFEVDEARASGDSDYIVMSYIVPETGKRVPVSWHLRDKNGTFKVVDVSIEGVSMAMTKKSEFASIIQQGGGDVGLILEHLRSQKQG